MDSLGGLAEYRSSKKSGLLPDHMCIRLQPILWMPERLEESVWRNAVRRRRAFKSLQGENARLKKSMRQNLISPMQTSTELDN